MEPVDKLLIHLWLMRERITWIRLWTFKPRQTWKHQYISFIKLFKQNRQDFFFSCFSSGSSQNNTRIFIIYWSFFTAFSKFSIFADLGRGRTVGSVQDGNPTSCEVGPGPGLPPYAFLCWMHVEGPVGPRWGLHMNVEKTKEQRTPSRLHFLNRLRSFNVCNRKLQIRSGL